MVLLTPRHLLILLEDRLIIFPPYFQAVSSRQLPLCCVVCNSKIQRVKNNKNNNHLTPTNNRKSLPSSVSGYSLSKSISNYSIKSGQFWGKREGEHFILPCSAGSATSQVSGRSVRSSPSLHSISSIKSNGSNSSWFSVNSLSSFQCAGLDKNHKQKLRVTNINKSEWNFPSFFPQLTSFWASDGSSPGVSLLFSK